MGSGLQKAGIAKRHGHRQSEDVTIEGGSRWQIVHVEHGLGNTLMVVIIHLLLPP
jgi:hypothetical protein